MKILITGGAGFIGSVFAKSLIQQGHQVASIDIAPPSQSVTGVKYHIADIRNRSAVEQVAIGCDRVLHLAAAHHDFGIDDETFQSVNVDGTQTVCEVMESQAIDHLCFFSTVAVYGSKGVPPIDETTPPTPESPYGKTKWKAEQVIQQWCNANENRRSLIIRPTVTFGSENYANMFTLIKQIDNGFFLKVGRGTNYKSLSYVENIVAATLQIWIGDKPQHESLAVFNYIDKPDLTSEQIANIVYNELGANPSSFRIPYLVARCLALPFDAIIALTGKNLPISGARIKKLSVSETKYESQKILDHGIEPPVPLEDGIRNMVRWYLSTGKHKNPSEIRRSLPKRNP